MKLQGQNVWLIGASSGIGAALAPRLAGRGATLAISARREEELNSVAAACPGDVLVKPVDTTDLENIEAAYRELVDAWGRVDVLIYGAGTWTLADVRDLEAASLVQQADVNYLGLMRAIATVLPAMIARRGGGIVGIASVAGYAGLPKAAAYSSSKAGVLAFLQSIRMELKKHHVEVISVCPGFVETPMTDANPFPMPFMLEVDDAADRIVAGILSGDEEVHFPRRLSVPLKLFTALPRPVFEFLARTFMARQT